MGQLSGRSGAGSGQSPQSLALMLRYADFSRRLSMNQMLIFSRNHGLSMARISVLNHLIYGGPATVGDIGEKLQVSNPAASQVLEKLVADGYVSREENSDDRRMKIHKITGTGRSVVGELDLMRTAWIRELHDSLSADERRQVSECFAMLLSKKENERC